MNSSSSGSPQLFFETINAYQRTAALKAAIELDLFTHIGSRASSAQELAKQCQCPERGIRILADNLTILGFLSKNTSGYSLTPDSAMFLDRNSKAYLGGAVEFLLASGITEPFDHLAQTIREGRVHASEGSPIAPNHPVWVKFARAMGVMMVPAANAVAQLVALDSSRETRILDIAASHGVYGITLAKTNPRVQLVALDWEAVLKVARENAAAAGIADRFQSITGDAFTTELGTGYDVILIPNFLHHFNHADCVRFLRKAHSALSDGGKVVIVEFVPNEDRVTPPASASFSLVMLGTTPEGDAYPFSEYQSMLAESGFGAVTLHPLPPTVESAVVAFKS